MAIGRRGFLKALGKGTVVGAAMATPAAYAGGIDLAKDHIAFNFTCACGRSSIAPVPSEIGHVVIVECECGEKLRLRWNGGSFTAFPLHGEMRPIGEVAETVSENKVNPEMMEKLRRIGVV
jgi:hypothetical protein